MTDVRYSHLAVERLTPQYWRVTFDRTPGARAGDVPG
jgi:hypothetical protein